MDQENSSHVGSHSLSVSKHVWSTTGSSLNLMLLITMTNCMAKENLFVRSLGFTSRGVSLLFYSLPICTNI